jgi:hypothetical protein
MNTCCISMIILYTYILLRYIYYTVGVRMSVKRKVAYYLYNNDAAPIYAFIGFRTKFGKGSSASKFSLHTLIYC